MKHISRLILATLFAAGSLSAQQAVGVGAPTANGGGTPSAGPGSGTVTDVSGGTTSTAIVSVANGTTTPVITADVIPPTPTGNALVSGGGVGYVSGLQVTVGAASYIINGTSYTSPITNLTAAAADPTNPRIDAVAVNSSGAAVIITGTPSATPVKPDVDPATQLELTFYLLAANATSIPVTINDIYQNNTEWTMTKSGSPINLASTNNPYSGATCIEATSAVAGNSFTATVPAAGTIDLASYNTLFFYIRNKAAWAAAKSISIQWYRSGVARGTLVTFKGNTFGFNSSSNFTTYQQIAIPTSNFGANGLTVDAVKFTVVGGGASFGWYIDAISLQTGISPYETSTKMQWQGTYDATKAYNANDVVLSSNIQYVALQPGVGHTPASSATYWQPSSSYAGGTVTSVSGTSPIASSGGITPAISLNDTAVTPGSYTYSSLTVDQKGRLTAASSGTAPVTAVNGTASNISSSGGTAPALDLVSTAVTPGSYTNTSLTVDSKGRLTSASSGTAAPSAANPTATVSGSAVNGSASTFMRSDAAPALASTAVTPGSYTNTNLTVDQQGRITAAANGSSASGTVTSVSVTTANGVSGSVATATTTPAISLSLGAITPTTVNGNTFTTGSSTYTGTAGQTYTMPATSATLFGSTTKADTVQASELVTLTSSSTDTFAGTAGVTATAYTTGTHYRFVANTANTGAASLNINGLGAVTIVKVAGGVTTTLADNDIRSGQVVDVAYDGTNFQLQSTLGNAGGSGTPGGSNTYVQYNNSGSFGGSSGFTYDDTAKRITLLNGSGVADFLISASTTPDIQLQLSGVTKMLLGIAGSSNNLITGSVLNDTACRFSGNFLFSADSGSTIAAQIVTSTGQFLLPKNITSSSTTTGTLVVTGGIGASGAIYSGSTNTGSLAASGAVTMTANTATSSTTTGTLVVTGGAGLSGGLYTGAPINVSTSSASAEVVNNSVSSTASFKLQSNGTNKAIFSDVVSNDQFITGSVAGDAGIRAPGNFLLSSDDGASIALKLVTSTGQALFPKNITSTSTSTGTVVITGGVGISENLNVGGSLFASTIGSTLKIKSGSNAKSGTFTLSSGTVTVSNTSITANSVVCCTVKTSSGTLGTGTPEIVLNAGTGFTATGVATDNSTYNFVVLEVN